MLFSVSHQALRERGALESARRQLLVDGSSVLVEYTAQQQQQPIDICKKIKLNYIVLFVEENVPSRNSISPCVLFIILLFDYLVKRKLLILINPICVNKIHRFLHQLTWYKCLRSIVSLIRGSTICGSFDLSVS